MYGTFHVVFEQVDDQTDDTHPQVKTYENIDLPGAESDALLYFRLTTGKQFTLYAYEHKEDDPIYVDWVDVEKTDTEEMYEFFEKLLDRHVYSCVRFSFEALPETH